MVCSRHFTDGLPTTENPYPTIDLGYERPEKKTRRQLVLIEDRPKSEESDGDMHTEDMPDHHNHVDGDLCEGCKHKETVMTTLVELTTLLSKENAELKIIIESFQNDIKKLKQKDECRKPFSVSCSRQM